MIIKKDLLDINKYSRPGKSLGDVRGIVVHWVAGPMMTAAGVRRYFNSLSEEKRFAGTQYVIGLEGEIIRMIPENEMAYHVGAKSYKEDALARLGSYPNAHTIGIETCHPDWYGKLNRQTVESLVELCADLLMRYSLTADDLWRHYDVTGKACPKYYVDNPHEWTQLKQNVMLMMEVLS